MQENVNNACVMLICVQGQSQLVMHQGQRLARNDPCPRELKGATCVVFSGVCRAWGGALRSTWFWTLRNAFGYTCASVPLNSRLMIVVRASWLRGSTRIGKNVVTPGTRSSSVSRCFGFHRSIER